MNSEHLINVHVVDGTCSVVEILSLFSERLGQQIIANANSS